MNIIKTIKKREEVVNLIRSLENPKICEVGVRTGGYFDFLLQDNVSEAYGVDIWRSTDSTGQNDNLYDQNTLDNQYNEVFTKYRHDNRVRLIREFSVNAARFFPDEYFDFIYIDADHTYDAVKEDLQAWYPKIKKGGILSGHDYISAQKTIQLGHSVPFGVIEAVSEFKTENNIDENNFHITEELYATYYIIKT